jgi:hypothetical protein
MILVSRDRNRQSLRALEPRLSARGVFTSGGAMTYLPVESMS